MIFFITHAFALIQKIGSLFIWGINGAFYSSLFTHAGGKFKKLTQRKSLINISNLLMAFICC